MPWLGIESVTFWFTGWRSIHWVAPARAHFSLNFKCTKETAKLLFSGAFEILLPSICSQFDSNKLIQILHVFGCFLHQHLISARFAGSQAWWIGVGVGRPQPAFLAALYICQRPIGPQTCPEAHCCHTPWFSTFYSFKSNKRERVQCESMCGLRLREAVGNGGSLPSYHCSSLVDLTVYLSRLLLCSSSPFPLYLYLVNSLYILGRNHLIAYLPSAYYLSLYIY